MDNPWADDPWNESAKKTAPEEHHEPPVQQKWDISSTPAIAISNDSQTTHVSPSWEPKESLSWTPAVDDAVSVPSWHAEDDSWTSPDISLPEPDTLAAIATSSSPPDERHESDEHDSPTPALVASNQENFQPFDSRDTNAIPQITASPIFNQAQDSDGDDFGGDGFGGFETGLDSSTEPNAAWQPSPETFAGTDANGEDAWGSSWEGADTSVREADEEPLDEWESARQQKAQQDRHVPPEYLKNILANFEELGNDLWKGAEEAESGSGSMPRMFDPQSLNLNSAADRIIPEELTLPLPRHFAQTFTSKRLVDSMKLTRHVLLTSKGPMAMYMASKGSTTWEASVKAKSDVSQEDVAPVGWKIVTRSESPAQDQSAKRTSSSGGIMSFFTRRSATTGTSPRSTSPAPSITESLKTGTNSPRPSSDILSQAKDKSPVVPSPVIGTLFQNPAPSQPPNPAPLAVQTQTPAKGLDFFTPNEEVEDDPPPASTMSRFLGRFSRGSKATSLSNRESVALSPDDLEFLSDVVPIVREVPRDADSMQLNALTSMIQSTPLPTTVPPLLAPPPPGAQTLASRLASNISAQAPTMEEDLFSFFDTTTAPVNAAQNLDKQRQPLPSIPTSNPSTSTLPSTSTFPDFFSSAIQSPGPPPPPIPPKASANLFSATPMPSNAAAIASRTTLSSGPSQQHAIVPTLLPPPPPANRSQSPAATPNARSLPGSRSQTPSMFAIPSQPTIDEDDEFADFITSPVDSKPSHSSFGSMSSSSIPSQFTATLDFDDFNDMLAAPSPPTQHKVPSIVGHSSRNTLSSSQSSRPSSVSSFKSTESSPRVSRAEHQRTMSLLETVASRGNTWLGPPSPLPEALPPPIAHPHKGSLVTTDLLGGNFEDAEGQPTHGVFSTMQAQQNKAIASMTPPPPPVRNSPSPAPATQKLGGGPSGWTFPAPPEGAGGKGNGQATTARALSPPNAGSESGFAASISPTPPPIAAPFSKPAAAAPANKRSSSGAGWSFPPPPGSTGSTPASRTVSPAPANSPPNLMGKSQSTSSNGFGAFNMGLMATPPQQKPSTPSMRPMSTSSAMAKPISGGKDGLSASDLAFFEGL